MGQHNGNANVMPSPFPPLTFDDLLRLQQVAAAVAVNLLRHLLDVEDVPDIVVPVEQLLHLGENRLRFCPLRRHGSLVLMPFDEDLKGGREKQRLFLSVLVDCRKKTQRTHDHR
jgi:hypothetical protein